MGLKSNSGISAGGILAGLWGGWFFVGCCMPAMIWGAEGPPGSSKQTGRGADAGAGGVRAGSAGGGVEVSEGSGGSGGSGGGSVSARSGDSSEPLFTLPPIYGYPPTVVGGGGARTGRQRLILNGSVSVGYDDNVLLTATHAPGTPAVYREVLGFVEGEGLRTRKVLVSPEVPAPQRQGSLVAQSGVGMKMQFLSRRSFFSIDAGMGAMHYWDRPGGDQDDYNGQVNVSYGYRVTPRLQISAQVNSAYLSQPDFTRLNTPQAQPGSEYLTTNAKVDLSYRWSPRLTSVLSLSDNALWYQDRTQQVGDFNEWIAGGQLQYLLGPAWSVLVEGRYGAVTYDEDPARDSHTSYLLAGSDFRLTQRLSGSLRLGEAFRSFEEAGEGATSPYVEASMSYRLARSSRVDFRSRYGFEEPSAAGLERRVWRNNATYFQALSARLSLAAGVSYLRQVQTTGELEDLSDTFEGSLRMQYFLTRRFSLNTSYVYTQLKTEQRERDYYRNRFMVGGEYDF
jgi:hypothetical protein